MPDGPGGWGLPQRTSGSGSLGGILREFHVPWPACNQDAARAAADAWTALADGIEDVLTGCNNMVASITVNNAGAAIDAFAAKWQQYGGKAGSLTLTIEACRALAKACNDFADQVSEVKTQIEHKAEELAGAVAISAALLIFSFGTSVAVAEAAADVVVAWVAALMVSLSEDAASISVALADALGLAGPAVASVAGATVEGAAGGLVRGSFIAMFNETFDVTLDAANGEPQPTRGEMVGDAVQDVGTTMLLGILGEAVPAVAGAPAEVQAFNEALDNPLLANAILSSAKIAELLGTPAGKAFVASGGIAALRAKGILDETGTTAKSVETSLEAALNALTPSEGE